MLTHLFNLISPVGTLPKPTGPYDIASEELMWDPTRKLQVKVTYPCDLSQSKGYKQGIYMDKKYFKPISKVMKMPKFTIKHYMKVGVNSAVTTEEDLIPLPSNVDKFPVAIFSHGWSGMPEMYTMFAESLASSGYIVVAPYHTDGTCCAVITKNGEIPFDYLAPEFGVTMDKKPQDLNPEEKEQHGKYRAHQLKIRTEDIRICLEVIRLFDNPRRKAKFTPEGYYAFKRRVDMSRLVCFGHSFGGGTAVSACTLSDKHGKPFFNLGISLDGWMEPIQYADDLSQLETDHVYTTTNESIVYRLSKLQSFPVMAFINSEVWQWDDNKKIMETIGKFLYRNKKLQYMWTMPNTGHHNYNDLGLLMPKLGVKLKLLQTDIDPTEHLTNLCLLLVQFIEVHLKPDGDTSSFKQYLLNQEIEAITSHA